MAWTPCNGRFTHSTLENPAAAAITSYDQRRMHRLVGLITVLIASTAIAAPRTLIADVDYDFIDQNGFGWATVSGTVTVVLTFAGKQGSVKISGKRRWVDGRVSAPPTPGAGPGMDTSNKWEGESEETYPLYDVVRTGTTITFKLDPVHDKLTGSCAPTKVPKLKATGLYECTITGFQWHSIAQLPALHHPFVVGTSVAAKRRILNRMIGKAKAGFGQRDVSIAKPPAKP